MEDSIDIERLREDLISYFGTASFYNKPAMMDLIEVEKGSDSKIIDIAVRNGFDLKRYEVEDESNKKSSLL